MSKQQIHRNQTLGTCYLETLEWLCQRNLIETAMHRFKRLGERLHAHKSAQQAAAKDQLGHTSENMTRHYVRHRRGKKVMPTK